MMRIWRGLALTFGVVLVVACVPAAQAAPGTAVPLSGNWEGTGPHGLPLSFQLARQGGRLIATSLAVGYPASCPAVKRDAEMVPIADPVYGGPGSPTSRDVPPGSTPAFLSGRVPRTNQPVYVRGGFTSPRRGTFSVQITKKIGCGWPDKTLTWTVHHARRVRVGDGTWTGPLTATGLINGNVRLVVGGQGRVVDSFTAFFTCQSDTEQGNTNLRAVPAFELVRPGGGFYSPLAAVRIAGHRATWTGRFSARGKLRGTLSIFDDCTNHLIRAQFSGTRTKPAR